MSLNLKKMGSLDPLEEINLRTEENRRPTYISKLLNQSL